MSRTAIISSVAVLALAACGTWLLVRRPRVAPPEQAEVQPFKVQSLGPASLLILETNDAALRALRWMPPGPGGLQVVQAVTQANRQRVALFSSSQLVGVWLVPKPEGVRDGFFNFAELQAAEVVPGDVAVLLYRGVEGSRDEASLVLALDLATSEVRWSHRITGDCLALAPGPKDPAVWVYGAAAPPVRLPLATTTRSAPTPLDVPAEVKGITQLLPTGSHTFLATHAGGLSAYLGSQRGWVHQAAPEPAADEALAFPSARGTLAEAQGYWWQPRPGVVLKVSREAAIEGRLGPEGLRPEEPYARDAALLTLMGADTAGALWFRLSIPYTAASAPLPAPAGEVWQPEAGGGGALPEDWPAYATAGQGRAYRWDPRQRTLQVLRLSEAWQTLGLPPTFTVPQGVEGLRPTAGAFTLPAGTTLLWVPLSSLPLGPAAKTAPLS